MIIKRFIFYFFRMMVFAVVSLALIASFATEIEFGAAKKLADSYLWQKAEIRFKRSFALDPFNASHFAGYAEFLRSVGPFWEKRVSLLYEPEKFYLHAYRLAPMKAEYPLKIALVKLKLFLKDKTRYQNELEESLSYFKIALKNDPNGFNVSYETGFWLVEVWKDLPEEYKSLAIDRLKYVLTQKRWFWEFIYPWVWQNTNDFSVLERMAPKNLRTQKDLLNFLEANNLYQFRREVVGAVDFYMKKEEPQEFSKKEKEKAARIDGIKKSGRSDWRGRSRNGKYEYENGYMYWTGTIDAVLDVPQGESKLAIQAKGSSVDNIYPFMVVELNGKEIGAVFVNNNRWEEYLFKIETDAGPKVISITFCNDDGNEKKNEDRNLYIGEARIIR